MGVYEYRRQRRGIHAELLFLGDGGRQFGVQGVDTLYHEHLVALQAEAPAALLAAPGLEVIARELHLLAGKEGVHLTVQQGDVKRVETLEVVVARLVEGRLVAVYEVIVERDAYRAYAVGKQLDRQALACGGLAARRRTGDEHHLHTLPGGNHLGNLHYLVFLERLGDVYQLGALALGDDLVEVADGGHAEYSLPAVLLLEYLEHLVLAHELA